MSLYGFQLRSSLITYIFVYCLVRYLCLTSLCLHTKSSIFCNPYIMVFVIFLKVLILASSGSVLMIFLEFKWKISCLIFFIFNEITINLGFVVSVAYIWGVCISSIIFIFFYRFPYFLFFWFMNLIDSKFNSGLFDF